MRVRAAAVLAALGATLAVAGPASALPREPAAARANATTPLEQAREESAVADRPRTRFDLPAGTLRLSASEILASAGQEVEVSHTLTRDVAAGTLSLTLPARWLERAPVGGLPYARVPAAGAAPGGRGSVGRAARTVTFAVDGGRAGDVARFSVDDVGLPAGTYELPYRWSEPGAGGDSGTLTLVVYAPTREAQEPEPEWTRLPTTGFERNVTSDAVTESETFLTVVPGNRRRFVVGANGGGGYNAWVTDDGAAFTKLTMPALTDAPGEAAPETSLLCCDPMSAADAAGNMWYGGLSQPNGAGQPSRIVVNRIAAGTLAFQPQTVGLRQRTTGVQDKPMMSIDNAPSSPRFGRLHVVWNEPQAGGGIRIALSVCDTRVAGVLDAARCDNADNWTTPVAVTPTTGSYIYSDVASPPDGTVNVVWWDYSALNAIRGDTCSPPADCTSAAAWGTPQTIATLDKTGGAPIPFACPIMAQPGGRASTAPGVEVDRSGGPNDGRVYVSWSDLRPGSGTTRCAGGVPPAATHLTWGSYVTSAPGGLPGGASPSADVATALLPAGEGGGQANSDDWFPWLAVDQTTGVAWADFYSTRDDATRRTTHFYARSVVPNGTGHTLGELRRVSGAASDYSTATCCTFGNDYGDYSGIDATQGLALPVWSDKRGVGTDGEAFTYVTDEPPLTADGLTVTDVGGDGDGMLEPGEPFQLIQRLRNTRAVATTNVSATLGASTPQLVVTQGASGYPDVAPGATQANVTVFEGTISAEVDCGQPLPAQLQVATAQGAVTLPVSIPTAPTCTPPETPSLTATDPPSGSSSTTPRVRGTAPAGSTVRLYLGGTCTGAPAVTGPAAELAGTGLLVTVPAGQSTALRATASLGTQTSACSPALTYVQIPPPGPPAGTGPPAATIPPPSRAPASTVDRLVAFTLTAARTQRALRRRALALSVVCPAEPCTVAARGSVSIPATSSRGRARSFAAGSARRALRRGQRASISLRLSAPLRGRIARALRSARTRSRVRATITVTVTDAAGNRLVKRATVRLAR